MCLVVTISDAKGCGILKGNHPHMLEIIGYLFDSATSTETNE